MALVRARMSTVQPPAKSVSGLGPQVFGGILPVNFRKKWLLCMRMSTVQAPGKYVFVGILPLNFRIKWMMTMLLVMLLIGVVGVKAGAVFTTYWSSRRAKPLHPCPWPVCRGSSYIKCNNI